MTGSISTTEPFSAFMERALYDPEHGFYATHRAGGARGDFITSVEVGPLFAALVGERLDRAWNAMGQPDPFRVAELGAGVGTLWRGIRRAAPACAAAIEYHLVEISKAQRQSHADLVGARVHSTASIPDGSVHVIFGNEVLDNVPFDIVEASADGWHSVAVATTDGRRHWAVGDTVAWAGLDHVAVAPGSRVPRVDAARALVDQCRSSAALTILIDYGATTAELAERGIDGWLRTYRGHGSGGDPLTDPGSCDITTDVPIDQLPVPERMTSQAGWLAQLGLANRVAEARKTWDRRANIGDLAALFARSAVTESAALVAQPGLGDFVVLEWD